MNGDITRSTFRPERHFSGVRSQQGRVQLDADWNEQADITGHRDRAGTEDVIGPRGGPWTGDGFQVGMMVVPRRLDAVAVPAAGQGFVVGDDATILASGDGGATWSRRQAPAGVTAALRAVAFPAAGQGFAVGDDATILATGDGGATWTSRAAPEELGVSAGRLYVGGVLCENERPVAVAGQPDLPGAALPGSGTHLFYLDVWQRHLTAVERPELREVALGGPDTTRAKTVWQVKWEEAQGKECADFGDGWVPAGAASSGRLAARAVPSATVADPCLVPPGAGYRRLENQCYRVEIHDPGAPGTATFKWSRDNGSVLSRVEKVDAAAGTVTITDPGKDAQVGFASAEFVELSDERLTLAGRHGTIVEVETLEGNDLVLPATATPPTLGPGAVARRWDSSELPVTAGTWASLESGVQVRFTDGDYQTGDYWLIPARTLTGTVDWPFEDGEPVFEGRQGIAHDYCPIGILTLQSGAWALDHDCRPRAPFLTALTTLYDVGGQGQESLPGDPLPQLLQVASPVPGASVRFSTQDGGVVAPTKAGLPASTTSELTVAVDEHQLASCAWRLAPDGAPSQLLEATLLDNAGERIGRPVRFAANLSLASEVAYDGPAGCATLTGADTVKAAIDALAQVVRISYAGGDGQESLPGQPLPQLLQVAAASPCGPATAKVRFTTVAGHLARTKAELPAATAGSSVDVDTVDGIASCAWMLAPDPDAPSQQTEARLLDGAGNPVGIPVRFTANLSVASLVAYDPQACPGLAGVQTVKEAIDRLCTGTGQDPGIRVKEVLLAGAPLRNDTLVSLDPLQQGIQVVCDQRVDPRCFPEKPTFSVTVDRPFPLTDADRQFWQTQELVGFEPLELAGDARLAQENVIEWRPRPAAFAFLRLLLARMQQVGFGRQVVAHLTVQGNFVWGSNAPDLYLDGDTFGFPTGAGGATVGIRFPSGDGRRGGDLRMWFRIGPSTPGARPPTRRRRSTSTSTSKGRTKTDR